MIQKETAIAYRKAGLSVLPASKVEKRPTVATWKRYQAKRPMDYEIDGWFSNRHDAICVVTGAVSGNLECIDFDNHGELFAAWVEKLEQADADALVIERTQSGGFHVFYRCETAVGHNDKLACGLREGAKKTLIETRGEGGLVICAPSEGYMFLKGDLEHIPVLSTEARKRLLEAARALDEGTPAAIVAPPKSASLGATGGFLERPGDDFARRGDVRPYLQLAGWQLSGRTGENELWTRPGKNPASGASATFNGEVFYVFSSNAAPFEPMKGYNQFQVYAILEHGGDFTAAARTLISRGYGKPEDPMLGVDVSGLALPVTQQTGAESTPVVDGVQLGLCAPVASQPGALPVVQAPQPTGPNPLERIGVGRLAREFPKMRPVLIHGFLRLGETMNVIAPPKTGKSWLVTDLAVSVATGTPWFGYPCEQGDVLLIDNELHRETSGSRIPKVIAARGFEPDALDAHFEIINMRGCLQSIEWIGNHADEYRERGFKLIIVDAFYRAVPAGTDENDNGAITSLYNMLDRYAAQIGCAIVLIHHTSKGNQALKSVTDVGAGAGSQSRAADAHVVLRPHKEKGVVVIDSVVRSFPSTEPFCARFTWPVWVRDGTLSTEDIEGKPEIREKVTGREAALEKERMVHHVRNLLPLAGEMPKSSFIDKISKCYDVSNSKAQRIYEDAVELGYLKVEKRPSPTDEKLLVRYVRLGPVDPIVTDEQECEETDEEEDV